MAKKEKTTSEYGVILGISPNEKQKTQFRKTFGCVRWVYNYFLDVRKDTYKYLKEGVYYKDSSAILTNVKKEYKFLKEVDKFALQNALKHLDFAYERFFERVKEKRKPYGFPRYKTKKGSKKSYKTNFTNNNLEYDSEKNRIKLPKAGWVDVLNDGAKTIERINGRIISATVTEHPNGTFTVSLTVSNPIEEKKPEPELTKDQIIALLRDNKVFAGDLGLLTYLMTADGHAIANPRWLRRGLKKLQTLQRRHARAKKGSKNKEKLRIQIAKQHAYIRNARSDFQHKLSSALVKYYDVLIFEDLAIKNMVKNKKLSKSISDAAWGQFLQYVKYKAEWKGKKFVKIDRFYASSKECGSCEEKNTALNLSDREWQCVTCKTVHDRDKNASFNILKEGVKQLMLVAE